MLTKLLYEAYPDYAKKHKAIKAYWTPEGNLRLMDDYPVPIHRGAIRYLKEIGKWTPEREARNKMLLQHQADLKKVWDAAMEEALTKKMKMSKFPEFWLKKRAEAGF
jgi:hypothetical protein